MPRILYPDIRRSAARDSIGLVKMRSRDTQGRQQAEVGAQKKGVTGSPQSSQLSLSRLKTSRVLICRHGGSIDYSARDCGVSQARPDKLTQVGRGRQRERFLPARPVHRAKHRSRFGLVKSLRERSNSSVSRYTPPLSQPSRFDTIFRFVR